MEKEAIRCSKVNKIISKHHILKDINLSVRENEVIGIIGRNASGKSMFFKVLCGLVLPTSGTVEIFGENLYARGRFSEDLGALIEYPGFLPQYSGYYNLKLLADIRRKVGKAEIEGAMRVVGLDPADRRKYRKYSLGMRQKLGIAAAIMEKPKILVFDEPTNNLDVDSVQDFRSLIKSLKQEGATILMASHNHEDIAQCCDKVYLIQDGVLSEPGPEDLTTVPDSPGM